MKSEMESQDLNDKTRSVLHVEGNRLYMLTDKGELETVTARTVEDYVYIQTSKGKYFAPKADVEQLFKGKTDKVKLQKVQTWKIFSFTYPKVRLTEQQIKNLEGMGLIPVQKELGETTRLVGVRLDTRNMNNLRIIQARLKQQGKKLTLTEIHRLALLKGIEQLMRETVESQKQP